MTYKEVQVVYKLKRSLYSIKEGEYGLEQEIADGDRGGGGGGGGARNPGGGCCMCWRYVKMVGDSCLLHGVRRTGGDG